MVKAGVDLYKSLNEMVDIWGGFGWLDIELCEKVGNVHNFCTKGSVVNVDYPPLVELGFTQFPHSFTTTIIYKEEDVWKSK